MYTRKTTMTRLINRLIERTVSLVSALRALPGPMPTMLTSPLGQAGIRPLPALAANPLAVAQERRGAMRISKRFKLSLMAVLAGLVIHSGLVSAATKEEEIAERINKSNADTTEEKVIQLIVRRIESDCITLYPGDLAAQAKCVKDIFKALCPEIKKKGDEKKRKYLMGCPVISKRLQQAGYDIPWACATKETGDQLCLISPIRVSSGDLLPISIDFGDRNGGAVDNVEVTVEVSSASGAELSQPYRDPQNPGDFDLTWTGGPDGWVGTASLGSISGTVSAQPVFALTNEYTFDDKQYNDSVTITGHVDYYTADGFSESMEVPSSVEVLGETVVTPDAVTPE